MITKAEAKQIDNLLSKVVKALGMDAVNAVDAARESLAKATEGRMLPRQLRLAQARERLPNCTHDRALMDWSGEQLTPPCGCRLVEPSDGYLHGAGLTEGT